MAKKHPKKAAIRAPESTRAKDDEAETPSTRRASPHRLPDACRPLMWKKGQSGNPAGRPAGSRNKFSEEFIAQLYEDFKAHGKSALKDCREQDPGSYLRVAASLIPKDFNVKVDDTTTLDQFIEGMDDGALEKLIAGISAVAATGKGKARKAAPPPGDEPDSVH